MLITGIKPNMRGWKEKVFGPVLPIVSHEKEDEAITLVNDTIYGLGGYIYTASRPPGGKARIADANRYDLPQRH
jgi:acyl-CoA reductase-like NAD-dependent aldehyde dehydrogenase